MFKEYEILSFIQERTNYIWLQDRSKGSGYWSRDGHITSPFTTEQILNNKDTAYKYSIHSIRRLSDNEILTVGDIILTKYSDNVERIEIRIKSFRIYKDSLLINTIQNFYGEIRNDSVKLKNIGIYMNKTKVSIKEVDEDYILNKECISINELIKELKNNHPILKLNARKRLEIAESLVKLVKSKIKQ